MRSALDVEDIEDDEFLLEVDVDLTWRTRSGHLKTTLDLYNRRPTVGEMVILYDADDNSYTGVIKLIGDEIAIVEVEGLDELHHG